MAEKIPVYDNHIHMDPSGRNVDAVKEFEAAGGTGFTLVTLPYKQIPITKGEDFLRSYEITLSMAEKAREATDLEINVAVGPYPVLILPLSEHCGPEKAEEMMIDGMEIAAKMVRDGKAQAIGEIGRPHFSVPEDIWDASNRILLRGMELAKEADCPVIIHSESGTPETNRSLSELARKAGLDPGSVVKHSSPPFVTSEETFGVMPSIPASKKNIAEALGKGSTRFMMETDYIDDPERPNMMMPVTTVASKVKALLSTGRLGAEDINRICGDIPNRLYHR
ncbi:MAG: TatD family hydrolase [Candidatus Methanoplasma sp.]|jgi:TatD-related deoxyribonuclease|nr:TatD family hydrolase [Candidatus Methanoplasma sp.]